VAPPAKGVCSGEVVLSREGVPEGAGVRPDFEFAEDESRPVTASLTVVPVPPLKLLPDTSSYVVMPAMASANTAAAATTGRRRLLTRER
jgi:hypothetical protein